MTGRERFLNIMNYNPVDRGFYHGPWAWPETIERWKTESYDPADAPDFGTDYWLWEGEWFFPDPPFTREVIEEDETTVLYVNHEGILMRERKDNPMSSMPQFVKFPVASREEFRAFCKERMQPDLASRIGPDYAERLSALKNRDFPFIVISDRWGGMFGGLRAFVGVENLCMLFYDDPDFVEEMMDYEADFIIAMMGKILDHTDVDCFGFWEDMAYKTGPLIGPNMMRKYALPRYKRVVEFLRSRGVEWIALDSDGDISSLIPVWLDSGINTLFPFEAQCGMDVVKLRQEYGRDLRMWGGIDKRALAISPEAIDAELERVKPVVATGGYIPHLDHGVPPDVSFANYCYYMERLRGIL